MASITLYLLLGGLGSLAAAVLLGKVRALPRRMCRAVGFALAGLSAAAGGYSFWYHHRPQPRPVQDRRLFQGVSYSRESLSTPRPLVVHTVRIDLDAPGIEFLVTPSNPTKGRHLAAQTVSQFLTEHKVQLAINASAFTPWYANGPLSYYPHVGDPVDVLGLAVSRGVEYASSYNHRPALCISRDNRVVIGSSFSDAYNAVAGFGILLRHGVVGEGCFGDSGLHPRTAVATDKGGRTMLIVVVDGRQPNYSEGVTLGELAQLVLDCGGHDAINMDGGGSSTLVIAGSDGEAEVLNSPIHGRVPPGVERPIATHLGVYARP